MRTTKYLIELTESLFRTLAQDALPAPPKVPYGDEVFDFGKPFEKLDCCESDQEISTETDMADSTLRLREGDC